MLLDSAGLALNYADTRDLTLTTSPTWQVQSPNFFSFIFGAIPRIPSAPTAADLLAAGIVLLMLTPYLRVVASVIYYGVQRDYRYLGITLLVLIIITVSLLAS